RERVEWLVPGFIPKETTTILGGEKTTAKSLLAVTWAAQLSRRGIKTLLLAAEDPAWKVIEPRLTACEANKKLIVGSEYPLRLPKEKHILEQMVLEHRPGFIILDLLNSFSGV